MERGGRRELGSWLSARAGRLVEVGEVAPLSDGFSAETLMVTTTDGERFVLRQEKPDPAVYPRQAPGFDVEVDIQFRAMRALAEGTSVPLAPLYGYEASAGVLGAPFFLMGFVAGEVPLVTPSYASEGFFFDSPPAVRRAIIEDGLRVMAGVHSLDWAGHGLDWLLPAGEEPTALRQVGIWRRFTEQELGAREHGLITGAFDWLVDHAPAHDPGSVTFQWGDPRPGNMIWRDGRCVCATDFEAVAVAPFGVDLGWWLMFDRWSHEHSGAPRLEGEPTREEQAAFYFEVSGRTPLPTHWYEVFAAARYSAIVVRMMNLWVARGLAAADNEIWRDNQATACLAELLA